MIKIAVAMLALAGSSASAASVLVVRAAGPSAKAYPAGKVLPDSARIALKSGDSIFLLNANSTRTLRGPGTFTVASATSAAAIAGRRSRFGATRTGELPRNPSPWNVDVTQSGRICVADAAKAAAGEGGGEAQDQRRRRRADARLGGRQGDPRLAQGAEDRRRYRISAPAGRKQRSRHAHLRHHPQGAGGRRGHRRSAGEERLPEPARSAGRRPRHGRLADHSLGLEPLKLAGVDPELGQHRLRVFAEPRRRQLGILALAVDPHR